MFSRIKALGASGKTLAAALALGALAGGAEARQLRVSSFEPATGFYSERILQAWIDIVNPQLSAGTDFRLYPGAILGAPPAQQELVARGVADVALVVPTYTPGLFPLSGVVELPGLVPDSATGTRVLNALAGDGHLDAEYAEFKVIALFTTPAYRVLLRGEAARGAQDLAGRRLRTPSPFGSTLLAMVGATGVSIPAPQVYENLERGVVDGAIWVFDAYRTFRLDEVAPRITMTDFTASPMAILMNRRAYEALSEADRAVIDAWSGPAAAAWVAGIVDAYDAEQEAAFRAQSGLTFVDLDPEARAAWDAAFAAAPAAWLSSLPAGIDGAAVLERAQALAAQE